MGELAGIVAPLIAGHPEEPFLLALVAALEGGTLGALFPHLERDPPRGHVSKFL